MKPRRPRRRLPRRLGEPGGGLVGDYGGSLSTAKAPLAAAAALR
nr:hypothetical protein [Streptomyces antibioticus]